jgi:ArsR family transcriptional regulator
MDKIALDKRIIGALASETRIDILKKIDSGPMTLSKLTDELNISKSTVHEHLTILIESGLVKKVNRDNKWVYYELTDKGMEILHPHKMTKIIVLLSVAILSFVVGIVGLYWFVRSIFIFPEETLKAIAPYEPVHLISGLILISLGIILLSFGKNRTKR